MNGEIEEKPLTEAEGVAQTERIGLGDLVIALIIAGLALFFSSFWGYSPIHPSVWSDAVVAAGVRPAVNVLPGYWTGIASIIYSICGIENAGVVLGYIGRVCLAGIGICVFAVLREWLAFAMRMRPQLSRRRTFVMRLASFVGAAAFVAADPVWAAGQPFSETIILLGLTLGALEAFFVFLRKGEIKYAYLCSALLGLIAAETPLGFVFPVIFVSLTMFIAKVMPALESPLFKPEVMEVGKWHMTFLFLAALIAGIGCNVTTYVLHGGVAALGETAGAVPLKYLLDYWHRICGAADLNAWILWFGVTVVPFVVTIIKFPASADEEQFLPFSAGLIYFVSGLIAFAQFACIPALWFWTYFPVNSQFLLTIGLFFSAAALAGGVTILGVDSLCRNHARLAGQVFGDDEDQERESVKQAVISRSTTFVRRVGMVTIPVFLLAMMAPGRMKEGTRRMLDIINDTVAELVREAGDAQFLFSDGELDCAIELESAKQGGKLRCYSLVGGDERMNVHLRMRGLKDKEDRFSFKYDAAIGLRSWMRDKPDRLKEAAMLLGFDLWKRDGRPLPPVGGLLSRPGGFPSEEERVQGVERTRAIIERMFEAYKRGYVKSCTERDIRRKFLSVQWRAARSCFYRGEVEDLKGNSEGAIAEANMYKQLNDLNEIYLQLLAAVEKQSASMMQRLTPREGLQLSLVRADFTMGKLYAETILEADPSNPDANFAMGMYYQRERQYSRAETYLKRCLIRKPKEPAIYNNLAMIQIEIGKFEAAAANVEAALKLLPGSSAVMDTKKKLAEAIEKANGEKK